MATEVNDHFYQGRTVLTEAQEEELERLLSYHDMHAESWSWGGQSREWFVDDAVNFLRDLLPEHSAYKIEEESR